MEKYGAIVLLKYMRKSYVEGTMKKGFKLKIYVLISVCLCMIALLNGCMTLALWDQGTVRKISHKKITTYGNTVHFQAKEKIRYVFLPFHWTAEKKHDKIFTAKSGVISEWSIETDGNAPRFSDKAGLPMYTLPDKSILLRGEDPMPESPFFFRQTRLRMHPDDLKFLQKPFLFRGYTLHGKRIITLQIPISFRAGKLISCLPEDSGIMDYNNYCREQYDFTRTWGYFWTPFTVICDILFSPVYIVIQKYK